MVSENTELLLDQIVLRMDVVSAAKQVLSFPTVGDKTFLVTIGDRSVTGLIARDQMVGPWQVPVADVGVTASGYRSHCGEAFAIGERTPVAVVDAPASGRMAIGEVITNIAAADIGDIAKIKLSANWMVAAGEAGHDADLFATVESIAMDICPSLGLSIPVGKDSMSMRTIWQDNQGQDHKNVSPLSLVVTGFGSVRDIRKTRTPVLQKTGIESDPWQSDLWLVDLGSGKNRLGASILAQVFSQIGSQPADLDSPDLLGQFFRFIQDLISDGLVQAYHDRSDGGLITTLCEMAFASRCGLDIDLSELSGDPFSLLFNEELGAVFQTRLDSRQQILALARKYDMESVLHRIGRPQTGDRINIQQNGACILDESRISLHQSWSNTTWQIQRIRDNPDSADQEYQRITDHEDQGLFCALSFDHDAEISRRIFETANIVTSKPKIAILREQGVNGQLEMAAAFHAVGFEAVDVTTTDLVNDVDLNAFSGFVACGGFFIRGCVGSGGGMGEVDSVSFTAER